MAVTIKDILTAEQHGDYQRGTAMRAEWHQQRNSQTIGDGSNSYMQYIERLEAALAEKNQVIFKQDLALVRLDQKLQDLMHQAVQFAEIAKQRLDPIDDQKEWDAATALVQAYQAQQNNGLVKGCHRSHPHEEMSETCILRSSLAKKDLEINRLQATIEKLLRLKALIERAYRGYGTPEQEIAKKQAQQKEGG